VAVGTLTFIAIQKQSSDKARISLQKQLEEYQVREKKYLTENKDLKDKLKAAEAKSTELSERVKTFDSDMDNLNKSIAQLTSERDALKTKLQALQAERDQLSAKVQQQAHPQIVYKYIDKSTGKEVDPKAVSAAAEKAANKEAAAQPAPGQPAQDTAAGTTTPPPTAAAKAETSDQDSQTPGTIPSAEDETYWAKVLKEKTALGLELDDVKKQLTAKNVKIEELKKSNSDLEMELGQLKNEKEAIEREIKYGNDLADNLSLALARAENEKKFMGNRVEKLNDENVSLRGQIKNLTSTKIALEKSIVKLQDDKKAIGHKLDETQNVIQNRIDEIWKIKDNLDKNFKLTRSKAKNEVELTPIVVSSSDAANDPENAGFNPPGRQGNVVSVNTENNFVIVDMGQNDGLKLGDNLAVYRGAEYVAALEVIQVRKDIAAADIKNKVTDIQVGDTVR
jgi:chromosome segregation ATPase